jgi:uncharacterized surface protein with fasciclin (FAS1) repeats
VETAGLSEDFQSGTWTVFAPTNQAFSEFPVDLTQQDSITFSKGVRGLDDLILFHAIDKQMLLKKDLPCEAGQNLIQSAMGKSSRTKCKSNTPRMQQGEGNNEDSPPEIVKFDIKACNGVIHTVNQILLFDKLEINR